MSPLISCFRTLSQAHDSLRIRRRNEAYIVAQNKVGGQKTQYR